MDQPEQQLSAKELKLRAKEEKEKRRAEKLAQRDPELLKKQQEAGLQQLQEKEKVITEKKEKIKQQNKQKTQQDAKQENENQKEVQKENQKEAQVPKKQVAIQFQVSFDSQQDTKKKPQIMKNRHSIMSHLKDFEFECRSSSVNHEVCPNEHIYQFVILCKDDAYRSTNEKSKALLQSIMKLVQDFKINQHSYFKKDIDTCMKNLSTFFCQSNISLDEGCKNSLNYVIRTLSELKIDWDEEQSKQFLCQQIQKYMYSKIDFASQEIIKNNSDLIKEGDVILTYASDTLVQDIIIHSYKKGINFEIIVCENPPNNEGRDLIEKFSSLNIPCVYTTLASIPNFTNTITKVFLSANSILINGTIISKCGTSMVACLAHQYKIPVIALCESYKFSERSQLDAFSNNELGDPSKMLCCEDSDKKYITMNLKYDLTPAAYVQMLVTEIGRYPTTSVPVILNEFKRQHYSF